MAHDEPSNDTPPADAGSVAALKTCYAAADLVLFVGAGVSLSAGLPGWESLLHRLTVEMWESRLDSQATGEDAEVFARLFQQAFGGFPIISGRYIRKALGQRFHERVRTILYDHLSPASELLCAITRLCRQEPGTGGVRAVVSYNYDDLVETYLAQEGIRFCAISGEGDSPRPGELPVYHVHGYLPRDGSLDYHGEIVFAEDAYHTQFLDPYGWANITQLTLLREQTGLFIGFSMTDPNLRRLLDVAYRHRHDRAHYAIMRSPSLEEIAPASGETRDEARLTAFVSAFRSIQEEALADLGIRVVWVEGFEDVPALLDRIGSRPGARPRAPSPPVLGEGAVDRSSTPSGAPVSTPGPKTRPGA